MTQSDTPGDGLDPKAVAAANRAFFAELASDPRCRVTDKPVVMGVNFDVLMPRVIRAFLDASPSVIGSDTAEPRVVPTFDWHGKQNGTATLTGGPSIGSDTAGLPSDCAGLVDEKALEAAWASRTAGVKECQLVTLNRESLGSAIRFYLIAALSRTPEAVAPEADSRLIAAAPDLLKALKHCVVERSEWLEEARAAISRAER